VCPIILCLIFSSTFVERNQVTWRDKHGRNLRFDRSRILDISISTIAILRLVRKDQNIDERYYLLSVFDEIMNINAIENDKRTWICKSMGNSQFHDMFVTFYGVERLRYIYLVRDPRDVAMSFMKTPVGDCHYYSITKKWAKLQNHALHVLSTNEDLVHQVRYESLLQANKETLESMNGFMGERKFGKVMRRGSVQILKEVENMKDTAKKGQEAVKAAGLSYQFKNLTRGESFREGQFQKWRSENLPDEDIHLIESVAYEEMTRLGYEPHIVPLKKQCAYKFTTLCSPKLFVKCARVKPILEFTPEDISEYKRLNDVGIKNMNASLAVENPSDLARRVRQATVLQLEATLIEPIANPNESSDEEDEDEEIDPLNEYPYKWPKKAGKCGYLSTSDVESRFEVTADDTISLPSNLNIRYAAAIQRGYYPSDKDKECQDAFVAATNIASDGTHIFAVFDGHGPTGDKCALYARDKIIKQYNIAKENKKDSSTEEVLSLALQRINDDLNQCKDIDSVYSGTTAVVLTLDDLNCTISNVGDSRCIIATTDTNGNLCTKPMTSDQTPFRKDELQRIKKMGGIVCSAEQYDHQETMHEQWTEENPPRIWSRKGKFPGCAFTRSIGDSVGESLGVIAEAEVESYELSSKDKMVIIGSDGIFEFVSDKEVTTISSMYLDPSDACRALVGESYKRWVQKEERTDDISVIVLFISQDS